MSGKMRETPAGKEIKSFGIIDFFVILICLSIAVLGVYLFYLSLHQTLTSILEPVGSVIIKYNSIQRRQGDRILWDRLRNESPLYPGDIIRVAELSGAVMDFGNNRVEVNENTLIRVQLSESGRLQIELSAVNLSLDTGTDGGNISLVITGKTIEAQAGTKLNAAAVEDVMAISVSEGSALLIDVSGQITEVDTDTVIALAADGRELEEIPVVLFSPLPSERFEIHEAELPEIIEITFRGIALEPVIIEELPLLAAPLLALPAAGYNISLEIFLQMNNNITFNWQPVAEANAYIFTLFHQSAYSGQRQVIQIGPQNATTWTLHDMRLLDRGTFIWQVEAVYLIEGEIERKGNIAERRFAMNIPAAGGVEPLEAGRMYGNAGSEIERQANVAERRFNMNSPFTGSVEPLEVGRLYGN
jgi:hypothetical protein